MTEPTPDTPPCAEPKPCCKCEAYREIIGENAAEIADLKRRLEELKKYGGWIINMVTRGSP